MFFYIYKITNKVNGRFYYGKHCTKNLDDGYMGSGSVLGKAFKKYGIENFEKRILKFFGSDDELCVAEARLVNQDYLDHHPECYNVKPGGKGGFQKGLWLGKKRSEQNRERLSKSLTGHFVSQETREKLRRFNTGRVKTQDEIDRQRESLKKTLAEKGVWNKNKKCPQISGERNGGYKKFKGTRYFNNGETEIRAFECPEGFVNGRLRREKR